MQQLVGVTALINPLLARRAEPSRAAGGEGGFVRGFAAAWQEETLLAAFVAAELGWRAAAQRSDLGDEVSPHGGDRLWARALKLLACFFRL